MNNIKICKMSKIKICKMNKINVSKMCKKNLKGCKTFLQICHFVQKNKPLRAETDIFK